MATYPCGKLCAGQRTTEAYDWRSDGGTGAGDGPVWGGLRRHGSVANVGTTLARWPTTGSLTFSRSS